MTCGVITIDFEEIGIPMKGGWSIGYLSGSAEVDIDKSVVSITVLARRDDIEKWVTYPVPSRYSTLSGDERDLRVIADEIERRNESTIKDKLDEWSVSIAEQQWEPREAAE